MLQRATAILLFFKWHVGDDYQKQIQDLQKQIRFILLHLIFFRLLLLHKP